ncbi:hypothetical protein V1478_006399 [Vespula squamosa]|uniref:Uncharacterized protein n=1 Tax=Vespula squamosa TaxID=30214 RepID=A0ABD2B7T1_VESSQ
MRTNNNNLEEKSPIHRNIYVNRKINRDLLFLSLFDTFNINNAKDENGGGGGGGGGVERGGDGERGRGGREPGQNGYVAGKRPFLVDEPIHYYPG